MKRTRLFLSVMALCFGLTCIPAHAQAPGDRVPDHYIVELDPGADPGTVAARHGVAPAFIYSTAIKGFGGRIPPGLLQRLQNDPQVRSITPDRVISIVQKASGKPGGGSTTLEIVPEGVKRVGAGSPLQSDGTGIGVAVVDTGIDLNHPDLKANLSPLSFSAFGATGHDDHGHGTHVAGTVAAVRGNGIGVVGVAPRAVLYGVKVLDASGSGTDEFVIAGLDWVAQQVDAKVSPTIRVVNMSLGRPGSLDDNPAMRAAIAGLKTRGITVVVAAGNSANTTIAAQVPACYPEVIAVASTTAKDGRKNKFNQLIGVDTASYFTTDGDPVSGVQVPISAPGEDQEDVNNGGLISSVGILSTALGGGTTRMSGTSMASPHVAGVAALLYSKNSAITPDNVLAYIQAGASEIGNAPKDIPIASYTFDGVREGVVYAPGALFYVP